MPIIDMPLEQLKQYTGKSPCPKDINEFWDDAVQEMRAVDARVELIPADFKTSFAECYHMYFYGVGGAKLYAKYVRPARHEEKQPALVSFHGYGMSSSDWTGLLPYAAEGFHIAALDCRGQAGKSQDNATVNGNTLDGHIIRGLENGPGHLYYRSVFLDTAQLSGILMEMPGIDAERIGCFGASQGGALALACAALEPRIKSAAALYPFLCDYKRVWETDLDFNAYREMQRWFKRTDPLHERDDEFFNTLSYIDIQNIVPRIQARVLMFTGLMDELCPPSTQFAAYNKIRAPKEMLIYPDFGHEELRLAGDKIFEFMRNLKCNF
jgi:Acetyl esterase (deacetylase)